MNKTLAAAVLATLTLGVSACSGGSSGDDSSSGSAGSSASASASSSTSASASSSPSASSAPSQASGSRDAKASKAIADSLLAADKAAGSNSFFDVNQKSASCVGDGMVDKIGTDQLVKYGLLSKDLSAQGSRQFGQVNLSASDATKATDVFFDCTDVENILTKAFNQSGANVPKAVQSCVKKNLSGDKLRGVFVQLFEGNQAQGQQQLQKPLLKCVKQGGVG